MNLRVLGTVPSLVAVLVAAIAAPDPAMAQTAKTGPGRTSVADTILKLDQAWGQAFVTGDSAFVKTLLAPDWIGWFDDAEQTREGTLAQFRAGDRLLEDIVDHARVRVFGTIAVVQARERNRVKDPKGDHWETRHITDVFERRKGRWVVVASHDSRIPNPT